MLNYDKTNFDKNVKAQAQARRDQSKVTQVEAEFRDKRVELREKHEKERRAEQQRQETLIAREHISKGIPRDVLPHKTFRDRLDKDWVQMEDRQSEERHALIREHDKAAQKASEADEKADQKSRQRTKPPTMKQW